MSASWNLIIMTRTMQEIEELKRASYILQAVRKHPPHKKGGTFNLLVLHRRKDEGKPWVGRLGLLVIGSEPGVLVLKQFRVCHSPSLQTHHPQTVAGPDC